MTNTKIISTLILSLLVLSETKKRKSKKQTITVQNNDTLEYVFIGSLVLILLGVLIYLLKRRQQILRSQKLRSIKRALQVKQISKKDRPCTMTQMQKDEAIAWFMKQSWVLEQSSAKDRPFSVPLQIVSLKRKQIPVDGSKLLKDYYDAFYVEMKSCSSVIFGVIMFEKYYLTILFDKSTSSSKNSTGTYDYKLFQGSLKKGIFEGKWYLTNDQKIEAQRQALEQKQRQKNLDEPVSQRSFSKLDRQNDELSTSTNSQRKIKGTFKLYHV